MSGEGRAPRSLVKSNAEPRALQNRSPTAQGDTMGKGKKSGAAGGGGGAAGSPPKKANKAVKVKSSKVTNSAFTFTSAPKAMNDSSASASASSTERPVAGLSSLQQKFAKKLEGARFRTINETLYTSTGQNAFDSFQRDPIQFDIYHAGFREQSRQWPYNPLHGIVAWLRAKGGKGGKKLRIADMGCGDAELAASLSDVHTVHSFDLVSRNSRVVASDIAHVPLREGSVDVVVFCLALMGTNVPDFVREAHRILAVRGSLRIAEVRSRFDGDGISIKKFEKFLKRAGFDIVQEDFSKLPGGVAQGGGGGGGGHNKMFFEVECTKSDRQSFIQEDFCVRPCVYKKR